MILWGVGEIKHAESFLTGPPDGAPHTYSKKSKTYHTKNNLSNHNI